MPEKLQMLSLLNQIDAAIDLGDADRARTLVQDACTVLEQSA